MRGAILLLPGLLLLLGSPATAASVHLEVREDLSLIYHRDISSPTTVVQILLRGGQSQEPPDRCGVAYLAHRLSFRVQDPQKNKQLAEWGTDLEIQVLPDHSLLTVVCLSKHLNGTLGMIGAALGEPSISKNPVFFAKKSLPFLQKSEEDDDLRFLALQVRRRFFSAGCSGDSLYGDETSRDRIQPVDVRDYHRAVFTRSRITVAVVSDLAPQAVVDIFSRHFPRFPEGDRNPPPPPRTRAPGEVSPIRDRHQVLFSLCVPLPALSPANLARLHLVRVLLDSGPGSRLWALRRLRHLAYTVGVLSLQTDDGGVLVAYLKIRPGNLDAARHGLRAIFSDLNERGVGEDEWQALMAGTRADLLRRNEAKKDRAATLAFLASHGWAQETPEDFLRCIEAQDPASFNAYLKRVFHPGNIREIILGPEGLLAGIEAQ